MTWRLITGSVGTRSRPPFAGNSAPPSPHSLALIFFLDRSLGKKAIAMALRNAGVAVELHDDHFSQNCPDDEWIQEVTARGWIILTKDKRVRRRTAHIETLRAANAIAFILTSGAATGEENGRAFLGALVRMERIADKYTRPVIATVSRSGGVKVLEGVRCGGVTR